MLSYFPTESFKINQNIKYTWYWNTLLLNIVELRLFKIEFVEIESLLVFIRGNKLPLFLPASWIINHVRLISPCNR